MTKMTADYTEQIAEFWPTIMKAWDEHGEKHPVIDCDVVNRKALALPAQEYINGLSARTRKAAARQYEKISAEGGMMLFIRDSEKRILQSHLFPLGDAP